MSLLLKTTEQRKNLGLLLQRTPTDVIELCKLCFEFLVNGPNAQRQFATLAKKFGTDEERVRCTVEWLVALLIDATKTQAGEADIQRLLMQQGEAAAELVSSSEVMEVLTQFLSSKRRFVEGSIKSANIRAHRLVHIEWRLEVRVASRSLLRQSNICVTMKLYLHTEPKNENRDLLDGQDETHPESYIHPDEQRNRKDLLVQTDLSSLVYMIQSLEDALVESRSRRIRNIVDAIAIR